jgi:hypothetical protein
LAAYAYNHYPLLLDLTDGTVHHILEITGRSLFMWNDLTPTQAYWKQAQLLTSNDNMLADRDLRMENISAELQGPLKMVRQAFRREAGGLREQLDSVVPFCSSPDEKLRATFDICMAWQQAGGHQLTREVWHPCR